MRLIHGDCLQIMPMLEAGSVQCVVTSPPYFGLRDYGVLGQLGLESSPIAYAEQMVRVFREVRRVLRDDGTLWLNLGDTYAANRTYQVASTKGGPKHSPAQGSLGASVVPEGLKPKDLMGIPWRVAFALQADGWYLRSDIIWQKPNVMPESVTDRPTKAHEYLFLLTKAERYHYDADAIKEPLTAPEKKGRSHTVSLRYSTESGRAGDSGLTNQTPLLSRNKRSVWTVPTKAFKGAHFATFPPALIEPCILAGSRRGDIVLDPFSGAGTTGVVCAQHGREYVGIELNADYLEMARLRIAATQSPLFTDAA